MICPVCNQDTLIVEYQNIELDYCPACRGVWFDSGELELLMEAAGFQNNGRFLENIAHSPEADVTEKKHRCPVCHQKMKKVHIDEAGRIVIDMCGGGHGIWFDGGEVISLVKGLEEKNLDRDPVTNVLSFVGEMFKYQV